MKALRIAVLTGVPVSCGLCGAAMVLWNDERVGFLVTRAAWAVTFITLILAFGLAINTDTGREPEGFDSI